MLETLHAFVAVNLDIAATRRIAALQRVLRASSHAPSVPIAWVSATNLHIAIRSLGQIDVAFVPGFADALRTKVRDFPAVRLAVAGPVGFPATSQARLIIVQAADASGRFGELVQGISDVVEQHGFEPSTQRFVPHIVLGRVRAAIDVASWFAASGRVDLQDALVTECVLYEGMPRSDSSRPPGAEYPALARIPLAPPTPLRSQRTRGLRRPQATGDSVGRVTPSVPMEPRVPGGLPVQSAPCSDPRVDQVEGEERHSDATGEPL